MGKPNAKERSIDRGIDSSDSIIGNLADNRAISNYGIVNIFDYDIDKQGIVKALIDLLDQKMPTDNSREGRIKIEHRKAKLKILFESLGPIQAYKLKRRLVNTEDELYKKFYGRLSGRLTLDLMKILEKRSQNVKTYIDKLLVRIARNAKRNKRKITIDILKWEYATLQLIGQTYINTLLLTKKTDEKKKRIEDLLNFPATIIEELSNNKLTDKNFTSIAEALGTIIRLEIDYLAADYLFEWYLANRWKDLEFLQNVKLIEEAFGVLVIGVVKNWNKNKKIVIHGLKYEIKKKEIEKSHKIIVQYYKGLPEAIEKVRNHWSTKFFNQTDFAIELVLNLTQPTKSILFIKGMDVGLFLIAMDNKYPEFKKEMRKILDLAWTLHKKAPNVATMLWSLLFASSGFDFNNIFNKLVNLDAKTALKILTRMIYVAINNPGKVWIAFVPFLVDRIIALHKFIGMGLDKISKLDTVLVIYLAADSKRATLIKEELAYPENSKILYSLSKRALIAFGYYRRIMTHKGYGENILGVKELIVIRKLLNN